MAPNTPQDLTSNLPPTTRRSICKKLNVPMPYGGDYKTFAGLIEMPNDNIRLLEIRGMPDPTNNILMWWERKNNATIANLRRLLLSKHMQREDVVRILDKRPQTESSTSATEFINDLHGPTRESICRMLNAQLPFGGDYKTLAGLVGMSIDEVRLLDTVTNVNPMDEVLVWWERVPERATISEFRRLLLDPAMRREDVVEILDSRPQAGAAQAIASETSDEANGSLQVATPETGDPDGDDDYL